MSKSMKKKLKLEQIISLITKLMKFLFRTISGSSNVLLNFWYRFWHRSKTLSAIKNGHFSNNLEFFRIILNKL